MKLSWNSLAGPAPQTDDLDWTKRLLRRVPNNPYGQQYGGQDFRDNIFVTPSAPANSLEFDKTAYMPEWLDSNGRLFQPK